MIIFANQNGFEMKKLIVPVLSFLAVIAVSCKGGMTDNKDLLEFVRQTVKDSTGTFSLIKGYHETGPSGTIAIIGEPEKSILLAERFVSSDRFDNIDGRVSQDGLPDFSGETFDVILDAFNDPYEHFVGSDTDSLREAVLRNVISAVDTSCYITPFNKDAKLRKSSSKIFVLASSLNSLYGQQDVDTLFKMAGRKAKVISPVYAACESIGVKDPVNVVVWTDNDIAQSFVYQKVLGSRLAKGSKVSVIVPEPLGDVSSRLRSLLAKYLTEGKDPLSVLILDDYGVDIDALYLSVESIRKEFTEEDYNINKLISKNFRIIDPIDALTESCYRMMRKENRFTHNIAYPKARFFQTEESESGDPVLIGLSDRYMSAEIGQFIDINTVAIKPFYVSEHN